ncbi:MAG TPA: hypothetical protein VM055_04670 [Novosphingobium sp.]|nr:hypothetical protein [Novosphingobium sp.]
MNDGVEARDLFREWRLHNKAASLREQSLGMLACMTAMMPLDYFFFPPQLAPWCTMLRIISMAVACVGLLAATKLHKRAIWPLLEPWILLPTPIVATLAHLLMVYWGPYESRTTTIIVTFGPCFAFYLSAFRIHRYLRDFFILTAVCIIANGAMMVSRSELSGEAGVFFFAISGTVTLFLVSRGVFARGLLEKFRNLRSLQPAVVARRLTVSDQRLTDDEAFSARDRFTVCLSSDWRNYQDMASSRDGRMISRLFEVYYNIVFAELARTVPSGRYYADWTADEIMVIFYGDDDQERETIIREALAFTRALASDIPRKVREEMGLVLKYDIGIAAGIGYLGLQGPSERRKTTIAGEVPGTAKRLETEGKELRPLGFDNEYPNVVMDEIISASAATWLDHGWQSTFPAGTKNIKGRPVTLWRCNGPAEHTLLRLGRALN